jgi:hypothetical protein
VGAGYDAPRNPAEESHMRVKFKFFRGYSSWAVMFQAAADFANQLPKDRLINIAHSSDRNLGVVIVWYWGDDEPVADTER